MNPKLSILVCTMPSRAYMWSELMKELLKQRSDYQIGKVQILTDDRMNITVGAKRNYLLKKAKGEYIAYIDDDDRISPNYIKLLLEGIEKNVDCCSLKGIITTNGKDAHYFEHSIKYKAYKTNENTSFVSGQIHYERFPNHLSCIKSEIAKKFKFPEISYGEDTDWATQIFNSDLIKTEHEINDVLYYYDYISNKKNKMKYSQNDEEIFILSYFKDKPTGKFIDIGAYDTYQFSNVRALFEKGWHGVLVEPSPKNYKGLLDNYKDEKRITALLNIAIGEKNGIIDFYACEDAVSTSEIGHMEKWGAAGVKYEKIKVPQVSVLDFMNEYCKDVDFISVDTESTNIIIFRLIPEWVFEQISLFCIEHDTHQDEIRERLSKFGFVELYENAENILLGKNKNENI